MSAKASASTSCTGGKRDYQRFRRGSSSSERLRLSSADEDSGAAYPRGSIVSRKVLIGCKTEDEVSWRSPKDGLYSLVRGNSGGTWGARRSRDAGEKLPDANCVDLELENEAKSGRVNGAKLFGSHCGCGCSANGGGMPSTVETRWYG